MNRSFCVGESGSFIALIGIHNFFLLFMSTVFASMRAAYAQVKRSVRCLNRTDLFSCEQLDDEKIGRNVVAEARVRRGLHAFSDCSFSRFSPFSHDMSSLDRGGPYYDTRDDTLFQTNWHLFVTNTRKMSFKENTRNRFYPAVFRAIIETNLKKFIFLKEYTT